MNKRLFFFFLTAATLFFFVPWQHMSFVDDDFGDAYRIQQSSLQDIADYFTGKKILNDIIVMSQQPPIIRSTTTVMYRPLWHAISAGIGKLCGISGQVALFFASVLHALNATLLMYLLQLLVSVPVAFMMSLLFVFNSSYGVWFGRLSTLQYPLNLSLLLMMVLLLVWWAQKPERRWWYYAALGIFACCLLIRESAIVFPAAFFLGYWLYTASFWAAMGWSIPLGLVSCACLALHLYLFGLVLPTSSESLRITELVKAFVIRMNESWLAFIVDSLDLRFLPAGDRLLKLAAVAIIGALLMWLFIKSRRKLLVLALVASYVVMTWPSWLLMHCPAFMYEALGLLLAAIAVLVEPVIRQHKAMRNLMFGLFLVMMGGSITWLTIMFKRRDVLSHTITNAVAQLAQDPRIISRNLCFVGLPWSGFPYVSGLRQGLYFFNNQFKNEVFVEYFVSRILDPLTQFFPFRLTRNNFVTARVSRNSVHLQCTDPQQRVWLQPHYPCWLGEVKIHKQEGKKVFDLSMHIKPEWFKKHLLFVVWDHEILKFKII